ncbi:MAG TPA: STAS domain-containing protein [Chitinivibrionales bacterium]|nr:STAS domain-containing protein [Chitinivibrionales bacterium]
MPLKIRMKKVKSIPVVEVEGRATDLDVKRFSKKLQDLYKKGDPRIVVDLSKTKFVDSHGLGIIVYYNTLLQKQGRQLVVLNGNPDDHNYVRRLFELTNLDKVMRTIGSISEL